MTAPIASGWSELPGGPCTHWKAPPFHGARRKRSFPFLGLTQYKRPWKSPSDRCCRLAAARCPPAGSRHTLLAGDDIAGQRAHLEAHGLKIVNFANLQNVANSYDKPPSGLEAGSPGRSRVCRRGVPQQQQRHADIADTGGAREDLGKPIISNASYDVARAFACQRRASLLRTTGAGWLRVCIA
jgi:hypothetical protein